MFSLSNFDLKKTRYYQEVKEEIREERQLPTLPFSCGDAQGTGQCRLAENKRLGACLRYAKQKLVSTSRCCEATRTNISLVCTSVWLGRKQEIRSQHCAKGLTMSLKTFIGLSLNEYKD